ncbi:MAG: AIR synthase-related protein, partial [Mycobacterium sp.]|nr:AIR synthase-related protein [Mycobacterium sp.]
MPAADIDLSRFVRPGDTILWGQGAGEPLTLTAALAEQAERLGGVVGFVGLTYNPRLAAPGLRLRSYGALGAAADMPLEVITCHMSALPKLLRSGRLRADVVLCQLSPADADGNHSLGVTVDYLACALDVARVVLGEVNPAVPRTRGSPPVPHSRLAATVTADHCLIQIPDPEPDPVTAQIGAQVAELVPDSATVQLGIGGLASDCAPLWGLVKSVLDAGCKVRFMCDATRGGLATVLNEAAAGRGFGFTVSEAAVPMHEPVR